MPGKCDICGKSVRFGHNVSHAHNKTKRKWRPNIQRARVIINGAPKRVNVCTKCLRSGKLQKAA